MIRSKKLSGGWLLISFNSGSGMEPYFLVLQFFPQGQLISFSLVKSVPSVRPRLMLAVLSISSATCISTRKFFCKKETRSASKRYRWISQNQELALNSILCLNSNRLVVHSQLSYKKIYNSNRINKLRPTHVHDCKLLFFLILHYYIFLPWSFLVD